jgi:SAM-dependent methyltransferase
MHPEYALAYRELYDKHWWWRAREDLILETLERLRREGVAGPVLDVGCGDGLFFGKLERFGPVEGVEMDPTGVDPAGPWASRIRIAPFDASFDPGKRYALVLLLDVLEHFPDPAARLARAVALLAPGGAIVLTVPAFLSLWTSHDELNRHFTRFTRARLAAAAREAGARVESSRYFFHWMFPVKLGAHLKEAIRPAPPRPPRIPPPWLNGVLYRLSRWEQKAARRFPPPFGNSLLAVLRRV